MRSDLDMKTNNLLTPQWWTHCLENREYTFSSAKGLNIKKQVSIHQVNRTKIFVSVLMGSVVIVTLSLRLWPATVSFAFVRKKVIFPMEEKISVEIQKELEKLRPKSEKDNKVNAKNIWETECWRLNRTGTSFKDYIREKFAFRHSLADYKLLEARQIVWLCSVRQRSSWLYKITLFQTFLHCSQCSRRSQR